MKYISNKRGISLVEAVIGSAIAGIAIVAVIGVIASALARKSELTRTVQATVLAEEGIEAMRFVRDSGWATTSALTLNTDYFPVFNGVSWQVQTNQPGFVFGVFDRRIRVSSVSRDTNQDIVTSGGTVDPNIKYVTVTVAWSARGATTTKTYSTYLGNIF